MAPIGTELDPFNGYSWAHTARTSSARHASADIATVSRSAPSAVAARSAQRRSSALGSSTSEQVTAVTAPCSSRASAVMSEESTPPESIVPTGTSAISRAFTDARSAASSRSVCALARERPELAAQLGVDGVAGRVPAALGDEIGRVEPDAEEGPGRETVDRGERGLRAERPAAQRVVGEDVGAHLPRDAHGQQRPHLAGEPQRAAVARDVQRLLAEAVAREQQAPALAVDRGER